MKIYVAGHRGMVGGAILRRLQARKDAGEALELITRTLGRPFDPTTLGHVNATARDSEAGELAADLPALRTRFRERNPLAHAIHGHVRAGFAARDEARGNT